MSPSTRTPSGALHRGVLVLAVSVIAGLLLALLAFPVVGGFGMLARAGADSFDKLPAELREDPLPQRSRILAADGSTLAEIYLNENRIMAKIDQMPEDLLYAIVAIEDARFYEHGGVDVRGLLRAFVRNSQAGSVQQGGSTITQQYVKNVLIESAEDVDGKKRASARSTERKVREVKYAIALERRYTKREILEKYLNIAYFGNGVYGVGTAAQYYFRKPVRKLTLAESALLAGMVKNPEAYNPAEHPKAARARRDVVLRRMVEVGFADTDRIDAALRSRLPRVRTQQLSGIEDSKIAPAFLRWMRHWFINDPRFGETEAERATKLFQGGLVIQTTLDPVLQRSVQDSLNRTLPLPNDPAAAAVVVKPGTGEVKAMAVVNHRKGSKQVNLATGSDLKPFAQPGSTFKPFTLVAALEAGLPLSTRISSPARYRADPAVCNNPDDGDFNNAGDSEAGNFDMPTATWMSVNTYYVQLQMRVGTQKVAEAARRMGVRVRDVSDRDCALTLGSEVTTPLEMAAAYATFAAQGTYCTPMPITSVRTPGHGTLTIEPECRKAIEPDVANTVTSILRGVIDGKHPHRTGKAASIGRPAAGKTGTTNGPSAAWFTGYTPDFAGAVWMGHPTAPTRNPLLNVHGVPVVYGGTFPAMMWREAMLAAHQGLPPTDFVTPPLSATLGHRVPVPDVRGMAPQAALDVLRRAGFNPVLGRATVPAYPVPAGAVGLTSPGAGALAVKGSTVVVYLSSGRAPVVPPPPPTVAPPTSSPSPTPPPPPSPTPTPTPTPTPGCNGKPGKCEPSPTPTPTPTPASSP